MHRTMNQAPHVLLLAILLLIGAFRTDARAHGDIHVYIQEVSAEIAARPDDASLYIKRGEAYRIDEAWEEGLADYEKAAQLDPKWGDKDYHVARLLLDAKRLEEALGAIDRYIGANPQSGPAHLVRARAHTRMNHGAQAAADYTTAFTLEKEPRPEDYLARAEAIRSTGPGHEEDALRSIEEGIARLGEIPTLELAAVKAEEELGRIDAALARLIKMEKRFERKEQWIARRVDVLERAGRLDEARAAREQVIAAIETLPKWAQMEPRTQKLHDDTQRILLEIAGKTNQGTAE